MEEALDAKKRVVFSLPPGPETPYKVAQVQGFQLCLDLMMGIVANTATAHAEMQRAEVAVWGVNSPS
ncbi:MAG: hypothetical protein ACREP9_10345 [Candidatus Dormibacteraceae bacterium]